MNCPTCTNILKQVEINGVQLDVCKDGCGGVWFDRFELQKVDEAHEVADETLMEVLSYELPKDYDSDSLRKCPKCEDTIMRQHYYSPKRAVFIDHCPKCAGYWLDEGELFKIRSEFENTTERNQAIQDYFSLLFDDDLTSMKNSNEEETRVAQNVARMFRIITPSFYFKKVKDFAFSDKI